MGSRVQNTQESVAEIMKAMQRYFGPTQEAIRKTYQPQAQAEFDITKEFTPQYAKLQYDTLSDEGRKLAELGRELSKEEQLGASEAELAIARGPGRELAQEAVDLQKIVDPEFMGGRAAIGDAITKALGAIDPNELTKGETESIARGIGRTSSGVPSAMETAKNAMTFGDALKNRRAEYNQAITTAGSVLPALRTGFTGFETATKRTLTPNWGQTQYTGIQTPGTQASNALGGQFMNSATSIQQTAMQKQKDWMDKMQSITGSIGNITGATSGIGF